MTLTLMLLHSDTVTLYLQDLLAHYGCVNALEFSQDGDLMVSGGDDRRVLLWNVDRATMSDGRYQPARMEGEHESNIFCLDMDWENTKVFSGGNDAIVRHASHKSRLALEASRCSKERQLLQ